MNIADILILLGILFFVALGFRDGFFKKTFGILGFLGGLILATKYMGFLAGYLVLWFNFSDESSFILAFFCLFVFVVIVVNLFYRWFGRTGNDTLKIWSRIGGGLLGIVQGVVAVSLILLMCDLFDIPSEETKNESTLYEDSIQAAPKVFDYTTRWMPSSKKFFDELKDKIDKYRTPR